MSLTDADLAARELENCVAIWFAAAAVLPQGASGRDGSVAWFSSGLPVASFNQVLPTVGDADPRSVEGAVAELRRRGVPFSVRIRDAIDDRLVPHLERLGLREDPEEAMPGMALHLAAEPRVAATPVPAPALDVHLVRDAAGLDVHLQIVSDAFGMPLEIARRLIPVTALANPGLAILIGSLAGRPVTTAFGFTADDTVGIYNVGTVDDARRRGYGAAITRAAVADGIRRGATVAILQSSQMGRHVYESLGFREVVTYRVFVEAAPSSDRAG